MVLQRVLPCEWFEQLGTLLFNFFAYFSLPYTQTLFKIIKMFPLKVIVSYSVFHIKE